MSDYNPEEYVAYRMQRAKDTIGEVKVHIENKFWNTAMNRMYYACFYAVGALLIKNGIETSSHSGIRQKFGQFYVITGKIDRDLARHYTNLFEKRQKGDYNDFFDHDEETVIQMLPLSEKLIEKIDELLNINNT